MDPITIALAGAGLVSSLFGGWKAGRERRRMNRALDKQSSENKAWYNANALSDYMQRADAQNTLRQMRNMLDRRSQRDANTAVVTGATTESIAANKQAANNAIADTTARLGAVGQQFKDRVSDKYLWMKQNIENQRLGMMNNAANGYENLMSNGLNMAAGVLGNELDKKNTKLI